MPKQSQSVQEALQDAHAHYAAANPKSHAQHISATEFMPGGNTRTVLFSDPFPITLVSAQGCHVESADGARYIDYLGEFTAGLFGHSHPDIKQAVLTALDTGWVRGGHIPQETELASAICRRFPSIERVRFANSGTEANLYAIQTARAVTGKSKVVVFEGGYHGGVFVFSGALSPLTAPFDFIVAPYNDWEGTLVLLEAEKNDIACVIIEAHQGSGGCIPAKRDFLKHIEDWTHEHDCIFILDEVMTSRLAGGGLQETHGLKPDMTTLGKYIGGGFSFGAFGGRADIMERYNPLRPGYLGHAGTFNNNVFTMFAGATAYGKVFTPEVAAELSANGNRLRERLNVIAAKASFPMQFTGLGSMMNVHMCPGQINSIRDLKHANSALRDLFYFDLLEQGIWPARRGMLNLSLPMGEEEFDRLVDAVAYFVEKRKSLQT